MRARACWILSIARCPRLPDEVLVRVRACGVCRTDLHVIDGELPEAKIPVVPGHEIVGVSRESAMRSLDWRRRSRWIGWLGHTCQRCGTERGPREPLSDGAFHGISDRWRLRLRARGRAVCVQAS